MQESRLFRIIYHLMENGKSTAPELAEKLEVSVRTIYRDIDIISSAGVPLRYNNDKRKKPLFSRGLSVCRHLFNSFSKLKCDEKIIEKRRLFH